MSEEQPGQSEQVEPTGSWTDSLPADLKDNQYLKGVDSVESLAKQFVNVQPLIGRKGIIPPKEGDPAEVWDKYYSDIGRPQSSDAYSVDGLGEAFSEDEAEALRKRAWEAGLPADAWEKMAPALGGLEVARQEAAERMSMERMDALKNEWGGAYDSKMDLANRAVKQIYGDNAKMVANKVLADGTTLGTDPDFIRSLADIGAAIAEGTVENASKLAGASTMTPDEAAQQYAKLMGDSDFQKVLMNPAHPEHKFAVQKKSKLFRAANASQAA